jgi:hypothetical protein
VAPAAASPSAPAPAFTGSWGLYSPEFPSSLTGVDQLQSEVGRTASYVMWYVHWAGDGSTLLQSDLQAVLANGSTPLVTWMSDDPGGVETFDDQAIAEGTYDSYIRSVASTLAAAGGPVLLRFDHEMNGNWYPWSPGVDGQTAAGYVAAFRHVHDLVHELAPNVAFVWSPNVQYTGSTPFASLYPGDAYVDYVGLDGYNWGPLDGHTWQSPAQVFGPSLSALQRVTSRPLLITEVGTTSVGGNKAAWITAFFAMLATHPMGFLWFDADKETDWQVDSSPAALAAFEKGLAAPA